VTSYLVCGNIRIEGHLMTRPGYKVVVVSELIFLTYESISVLKVINTNYIHYSGYNVTKRELIIKWPLIPIFL